MRAELVVASLVCAILVVIPLPWHWRARNIATLSMAAWLCVVNLIRLVNTIVWADNVRMTIPVWCDITTKIYIGSTLAIPAASFCICRYLENVASARYTMSTDKERRNRMLWDFALCNILPLIFMALHYIVQGHRFDIFEDYGCSPNTYISIEAVFVVWVPPLIFCLGTLVYASLALRHFIRRRIDFDQHLRNSHTGLTSSRYLRLMALAVTAILWGTPIAIVVLYWNIVDAGLRPYTSWADVHFMFSRVIFVPQRFMSPTFVFRTNVTMWIIPITSILFFIFFGFGDEAIDEYRKVYYWVARTVFRQTFPTANSTLVTTVSMPSARRNHHTFGSITSFSMPEKWGNASSSHPGSVDEQKERFDSDSETASKLSLSYSGPPDGIVDLEIGLESVITTPDHDDENHPERSTAAAAHSPRTRTRPLSCPPSLPNSPPPPGMV